MSQISMPMRILLIGAVVFLAAWFTILKPKPVTAETDAAAPSTAAQTSYGKAVEKARDVAAKVAATATPAPGGAAPAATPEAGGEAPVAIPDEELAKLPKRAAAALQQRKILVLGVFADGATRWRPMPDDDRYVRNALRKTNRYDGDVVVVEVDISKLSAYGALVNDLHVNQSPAVIVIDRDLKGRALTGYVDRISINQLIADARDATTSPNVSDPYLRTLQDFCGDYKLRLRRRSNPTVRGADAWLAKFERDVKMGRDYVRRLEAIDAPAKWRSLQQQFVNVVDADIDTAETMIGLVKRDDLGGAQKASAALDREPGRRLDRRFDELGVTNCVFNRRS